MAGIVHPSAVRSPIEGASAARQGRSSLPGYQASNVLLPSATRLRSCNGIDCADNNSGGIGLPVGERMCQRLVRPGTLPSCGTQGTQLTLAVAAFTSIDPATDSGCVTFAANTSPDTVEYLVLPWSAGGNTGSSAPFALESATPLASITGRVLRCAPAIAGRRPRRSTGSCGRSPGR